MLTVFIIFIQRMESLEVENLLLITYHSTQKENKVQEKIVMFVYRHAHSPAIL